MFDPGSITLAPTVITSNTMSRPGDSTSSRTISSSITLNSPPVTNTSTSTSPSTSTIVSTTIRPPISSTSDFLGPTSAILPSYHSISAISLSSISADDPTSVTPTSTSAAGQTTVTVSVVETAVLSSDTPQHTGFAHHTGAIIGIAIGGTFLLLLIILLIYFACRHDTNGPFNRSEDIFALPHNSPWRSPLEADDDEDYLVPYGRSVSYPRSFGSQGHDDGRFFGDHLSVEGSGSAESADANGASLMQTAFGGQPLLPPVAQTLHGSKFSRDPSISPNPVSDHGHDASRPWWGDTAPLNINKRNSSKQPPLSADSHVSAGSLGEGGLSSGEAPLLEGKTRRYSITEPRPIHKLSGRKHYSSPPTAFVVGPDSNLEYAAQRIQQYREEQKQQDSADQTLSQIILARIRRPSTATTSCSHCTMIRSEESDSSRSQSYTYSPSLLNPPMIVPGLYPPQGVVGNSGYTPDNSQHRHRHQGLGETPEKLFWPSVTLPPVPSTDDNSSMIEGLLHPRLGMALAHSQQASSTSLRDHEDYTRPINGLVNNHIQSTTTFDHVDLCEGAI